MTYNPEKTFRSQGIEFQGAYNNRPCIDLVVEQKNRWQQRADTYFSFETGLTAEDLKPTFYGIQTPEKPRIFTRVPLEIVREHMAGNGQADPEFLEEITSAYINLLNREHTGHLAHSSTRRKLILPNNTVEHITRDQYEALKARQILKRS